MSLVDTVLGEPTPVDRLCVNFTCQNQSIANNLLSFLSGVVKVTHGRHIITPPKGRDTQFSLYPRANSIPTRKTYLYNSYFQVTLGPYNQDPKNVAAAAAKAMNLIASLPGFENLQSTGERWFATKLPVRHTCLLFPNALELIGALIAGGCRASRPRAGARGMGRYRIALIPSQTSPATVSGCCRNQSVR